MTKTKTGSSPVGPASDRRDLDRRLGDRRFTPYTIAVLDRISESGLSSLIQDPEFDVLQTADWSAERVDDALAVADAVIVRSRTAVNRELLAKAPRLRVVGRAGVGVDNIDLTAATERGVAVINAPEGNTVSAAEHTMALILAAARNVVAADRSMRNGKWTRSQFAGSELRGKVLGLVGAGRIGGAVARRARAFGMTVRVFDPHLTDDRARELGAEPSDLERLIEEADVLTLHVPLTDSTRGMIGASELRRMKTDALLVNVARGGVVDEAALAAALMEGQIAGAALDVFESEPLDADSPLRGAPNLVLTPHLGASTAEAQELIASEIAEGIRRSLVEGDLARALNAPQVGGEALRRLKDLLDLGARLGRLSSALAQGPIESVEVRYAGSHDDAPRPLSQAVLAGLLEPVVGKERVNFVSAGHLARERGIRVTRSHTPSRPDYGEYLEVVVQTRSHTSTVAGAVLGPGHPRLVRVDDYRVDVIPHGSLLVLRNLDVPGVIGRVGTLLGAKGVNIGEYHQSRRTAGGEALAVISIDDPLSNGMLEQLEAGPDVVSARAVDLG